jgi:replicative DNA helicase
VGVGEFVRQWVLLARRQAFRPGSGEHCLVMAVGGSAGHSGCWQLDVSEGGSNGEANGRHWRVRVSDFQYGDGVGMEPGF